MRTKNHLVNYVVVVNGPIKLVVLLKMTVLLVLVDVIPFLVKHKHPSMYVHHVKMANLTTLLAKLRVELVKLEPQTPELATQIAKLVHQVAS